MCTGICREFSKVYSQFVIAFSYFGRNRIRAAITNMYYLSSLQIAHEKRRRASRLPDEKSLFLRTDSGQTILCGNIPKENSISKKFPKYVLVKKNNMHVVENQQVLRLIDRSRVGFLGSRFFIISLNLTVKHSKLLNY